MKNQLSILVIFFAANALAGKATKVPGGFWPISEPVTFEGEFAKKVINVIKDNVQARQEIRVGATTTTYNVDDGLLCAVTNRIYTGGKRGESYECALLPEGGWGSAIEGTILVTKKKQFVRSLYLAMGNTSSRPAKKGTEKFIGLKEGNKSYDLSCNKNYCQYSFWWNQ